MTHATIINKTNLSIVAVVAVLGFCVIRLTGSGEAEPETMRTRGANVKRVISGHKIKIEQDDEVVYAGIRAPYRNERLGEESYALNQQLVDGKRIRMRFDVEQRDEKDRWLAYVFVDGAMVNERLVADGLAYVRLRAGETRFSEELLSAQREARAARRGLWKRKIKSQATEYPADQKHATFHLPDCEDVANTRPENHVVFASKVEAFDSGFAPCNRCQP